MILLFILYKTMLLLLLWLCPVLVPVKKCPSWINYYVHRILLTMTGRSPNNSKSPKFTFTKKPFPSTSTLLHPFNIKTEPQTPYIYRGKNPPPPSSSIASFSPLSSPSSSLLPHSRWSTPSSLRYFFRSHTPPPFLPSSPSGSSSKTVTMSSEVRTSQAPSHVRVLSPHPPA